jgi:hypothetical protein
MKKIKSDKIISREDVIERVILRNISKRDKVSKVLTAIAKD